MDGSPTLMSPTRMVPLSKGSSPLTHLISVDLPEPEGPQITTTSPFATEVEQSLRAWNEPKALGDVFQRDHGLAC